MTILISRGAKVSCENSSRSHFWTVARRAAEQLGLIESWDTLVDVAFDACMWGSTRIKDTTFRATKGSPSGVTAAINMNLGGAAWAKPESFSPLPVKPSTQSHCAKHRSKHQALSVKRVPPLLGEFWLICPESAKNLFPGVLHKKTHPAEAARKEVGGPDPN